MSAASSRPELLPNLPIFSPPGIDATAREHALSLVLDPERRRGYQIFRHEDFATVPPGRVDKTFVTSFDLDSFQPIRQMSVSGLFQGSGPHIVDPASGKIFLQYFSGPGSFAGIGVLDTVAFEAGRPDWMTVLQAPVRPETAFAPAGIRYEGRTGRLLLLFNPQRNADIVPATQGNAPIYYNTLVQWDPHAAPVNGGIKEDWSYRLLRTCATSTLNVFLEDSAAPFISRDGKSITAACGFGDGGAQLVRLPISGPNAPTAEEPLASVGAVRKLLVDADVERVQVASAGGNGGYIAAYDSALARLAGTSVVSRSVVMSNIRSGLDSTTGRLYFLVPPKPALSPDEVEERGGLVFIDGRRTPVPQGLVFREFAYEFVYGNIEVDNRAGGGTRRLFALIRTPKATPALSWKIITDPVPVAADPPGAGAEPTADVDEQEGKTERAYAGEASAYGLRFLAVGGLTRNPWIELVGAGPCVNSNRAVVFGYVERSGLSSVSTVAEAHGLEGDIGTQSDLRDTSRCRPVAVFPGNNLRQEVPEIPEQARNQPGQSGWPGNPAECSGEGKQSADSGSTGKASVECQQRKEVVEATTSFSAAGNDALMVGRQVSGTKLYRDSKLGLVAESHARTDNVRINLGDQSITIGSVISKATSRSNGRIPAKDAPPRTEWSVELCGVKGPGIDEQGCQNQEESAELLTQLNVAGRGRVVFRQPAADQTLLKGTPHGYLAGVERDKGDASLNRVETGDELVVVPGLEVQFRHADQPTVNRHIFQLAGVRAVAAYGIFELPDDVGSIPEPPPPDNDTTGADVIDQTPLASPVSPPKENKGNPFIEIPKKLAENIVKTLKAGFGLLLRGPFDSLLAFGAWSTFGLPVYLYARRRRIGVLA